MIIVETAVSKIDHEMDILKMIEGGQQVEMYRLGAWHALYWIKKGGMPPSETVANMNILLQVERPTQNDETHR
jgi:hypothetical protein